MLSVLCEISKGWGRSGFYDMIWNSICGIYMEWRIKLPFPRLLFYVVFLFRKSMYSKWYLFIYLYIFDNWHIYICLRWVFNGTDLDCFLWYVCDDDDIYLLLKFCLYQVHSFLLYVNHIFIYTKEVHLILCLIY